MRFATVRLAARVALAPLLLSACYTTIPLGAGSPEPRSRVVVRLTEPGSRQLAGALGPDVATIDARVDAVHGDTLDLLVGRVYLLGGGSAFRDGAFASIPRSTVASLEVRKLERGRSYLLAGAVAAGAVMAGRLFFSEFFGDDPASESRPRARR
ncbi:MAG TPA: hypothetical protein VF263_03605 [Longimicrobiaceae bacterium]